MVSPQSPQSIALVLGSGGILGGAFHAGVLKALHDVWGIDARDVDVIVGTSCGAMSGAFVAGGLHPNDLFRRETRQPLSPVGARIVAKARPPERVGERPRSSVGGPAALEVLGHAALRPWSVAPGSVMAGLLPRGTNSTEHLGALIDGLVGSAWPTRPRLRICAVDVHTGQRVVFDSTSCASPGQAGAASCSVPSVFAPVTIGDREYVDGGAHSADNLDVVGAEDHDLVIVSSPMSSVAVSGGRGPWGLLRAATRAQSELEQLKLRGCRVEVIRPTAKDLDAMGTNLLDASRRAAVALQAHASASQRFRQLERNS